MFKEQVIDFLSQHQVSFRAGCCELLCEGAYPLRIVLVETSSGSGTETTANMRDASGMPTLFLYEDLWRSKGPLVRSRLLSMLGRQKRIYARNCRVEPVSAALAASFLRKHHLYGATKASVRYCLVRDRATGLRETGMEQLPSGDRLVAVALFSPQGSGMWQWERYACLSGYRVDGGMGKIFRRFIADHKPSQVMTYADLEWSEGAVYRLLGFCEAGDTEPVEFVLDPLSGERIHLSKIGRDRKWRDTIPDGRIIRNLGSRRWIIDFPEVGV